MITIPELYDVFGNAGVAAIAGLGTFVVAFIGITVLMRLVEAFVNMMNEYFQG